MLDYKLQFRDVFHNYEFFIEGIKYTLLLSISAMLLAILIGTFVAMARMNKNKLLHGIATAYVEVLRNTPLIIQIWLIYFGLAEIGIQISALASGLLALTINTGAYTAEILRAGFESIDIGIKEAAASLGMTPWQIYRVAIFPLGFRSVLPALCNMSIQCLLASALISIIGVNELTNQAMRLSSKTLRVFETFLITAVIYIIFTFGYTLLFNFIEKKVSKGSLH